MSTENALSDQQPVATPETAAHEQQRLDELIQAIKNRNDVEYAPGVNDDGHGRETLKLSKEDLDYLVAKGAIVDVGKSADTGKSEYVVPNTGNDKLGLITLVDRTTGDSMGDLKNEGTRPWTPDYVKDHILPTDQEITRGTTDLEKGAPDAAQKERYDELLAYATKSLKDNGASDTRILVDNASGSEKTDITLSKGGNNYITIPKQDLNTALASEDGLNKMKGIIDANAASIKNGDNTVDAIVRNHEIQAFQAGGKGVDGKTFLPDNEVQLSDGAMAQMVKNRQLIELNKDTDLDAQSKTDIAKIRASAALDGHPLPRDTPVYLMPGTNNDLSLSEVPQVLTTTGGKPYVVVDEKMVNPTEDNRRASMQSDADIAKDIKLVKQEDFRPEAGQEAQYKAFIDHIRPEGGANAPTVLINQHASAPDVASEQSKEGREYLYISAADLKKGLADPKEMEQLQAKVGQEQTFIKNGDNSPAGLVASNKAAHFLADFSNSRTAMPDATKEIDPAALEQLKREGQYVQVDKADIVPAGLDAIAKMKDRDGKSLPADTPIYVMPDLNRLYSSPPTAQLMHTTDGKPYVLVDDGLHRQDEKYVKNHLAHPTDAGIAALKANNQLLTGEDALQNLAAGKQEGPETERMHQRYQELLQTINKDAKDVHPTPTILVENVSERKNTNEGTDTTLSNNKFAVVTKEGANYIMIGKDAFKEAMTNPDDTKFRDLKTAVGHEIGHIADGDQTDAGIAKMHNLAVARGQELLADLAGAGPKEGHDAATAVKEWEDDLKQSYRIMHPKDTTPPDKLTDAQLKETSAKIVSEEPNDNHPSDWERLTALRHEAGAMDKYEQAHAKPSPQNEAATAAYKQAESDAVIADTLKYMKDTGQYQYPTPDQAGPNNGYKEIPVPQTDAAPPSKTDTASAKPGPVSSERSDAAASLKLSDSHLAAIDAVRAAMGDKPQMADAEKIPTSATPVPVVASADQGKVMGA